MRRLVLALCALACAASPSAALATMTSAQRLADAQSLVALYAHRYGPLEWKEAHLGLSFEKLAGDLLAAAEKEMSDEDFYGAMMEFLAKLEDAHVSLDIPSSRTAYLGFDVDFVGGEVVISDVDRKILPASVFPFERGDVLVSIDNIPAARAIQQLARFRDLGYDAADKRLLASRLTYRAQMRMPSVPEGVGWLVIRSRADGTLRKIGVPWNVKGNELAPMKGEVAALSKGWGEMPAEAPAGQGEHPLDRLRRLIWKDAAAYDVMGDPKPFFPLWEGFEEIPGAPLFTGTFPLAGKRIGFIRIPTWMPDDEVGILRYLAKEIPQLDAATDALIIDQTGNGGGNGCYLELMTSMFLVDPLPTMLFRLRANRAWLVEFEWWLRGAKAGSSEEGVLKKIVGALRAAIAGGQPLTDPFPICSTSEQITPIFSNADGKEGLSYTKPILILINELDASAADVFPAIMQDGGRAKLFGVRTMGAGGNVTDVGPFGFSDITVTVTESLMWRPSAVPDGKGGTTHYIENIGVTPDFPYAPGLEDFLGGYEGYKAAVEDAVLGMVGG